MKNRIFLGGTCAESTWRDELIPQLTVDYFNPVVKDWTPECQQNEIDEKENKCNVHFYCITKEMKGVFSIAEVIDSCHQKSKVTILQVMPNGFEEFQLKSLKAVIELVKSRGGEAYMSDDIDTSAIILNCIK